MTRYNNSIISLYGLCFLGSLFMVLDCSAAFTLRPSTLHSSTLVSVGTKLYSTNDNDAAADADDDESDQGAFNWLEEWALEGKDAVALMKTQERTQRVMLAQMTEDRIYEITKVLDTLVDQETGQVADADLPKAKELALQTRNLQKEYKDLVTGAPSTMLETLANLNLTGDDEKTKDSE